jgi:hypothetical protein
MPEKCPLSDIDRWDLDRAGFAWDTGIPDGCHPCINRALESDQLKRIIFEQPIPEEYMHSDASLLGGFRNVGVRIINDSSEREVREEVGEEVTCEDDGIIGSITTLLFHCTKAM